MQGAKSVAERLRIIQGHPLRRDILQAMQEAHAMGRLVSATGLAEQFKGREKVSVQNVCYHLGVLAKEGAVKELESVQRRGALEHLYGINEDLIPEITDAVALDQIAELIDGYKPVNLENVAKIVRSTGRPVEA